MGGGFPSFEAAGDEGDRVWSGETTTGMTGRRIISSGIEPAGEGCAERRFNCCSIYKLSFLFKKKANILRKNGGFF